jgi:hypothetical protein
VIASAEGRAVRQQLRFSTLSHCRRLPKLTNLTFRRSFVSRVSPVKGIFLSMPGLWRTENLPKLPSFSVKPSVPRLLSSVVSKLQITTSTMCSASFLVDSTNIC